MRISRLLTASALLALCRLAAAAPVIQNVVNAANFQQGIASATWVAISGTGLATSTRAWGNADFSGGKLPVKLDDVQVTINGIAAYIYFVSPGQINVLVPDDPTIGTVNVIVTNAQGTSNSFPTNKVAVSPALFAFSQLGYRFAVVQTLAYGLVGPPGLLGSAVTTTTAAPGNSLILYGTGLGPASPAQPTGQLVTAAAATANNVTVTIGGQPAQVLFAGLIGSGLYQINVVVPPLLSGDALVVVTVAGRSALGSVYIPIQAYGDPNGQTNPPLVGCVSGPVDYISYNAALLYTGETTSSPQTVDMSIGGTKLCTTCNIKPPLYPEFTDRLENALEGNENVQACYDKNGVIFQIQATHL